jgi:L-lactate dehydrogenase complex protein LldG
MSQSSREKILNRLEKNARVATENVAPGISFFRNDDRPLLQIFCEQLLAVKGEFILCNSPEQFRHELSKVISDKKLQEIFCNETRIRKLIDIKFASTLNAITDASITGCEFLVAHTGSVVVSTSQTKSRRTFAYPPIHLVVAFRNQLLRNLDEVLNLCAKKYDDHLPSQITVITGPSRTADIEKTLVLGAHGPKELIIFYLDVDLVE